MCKDLGLSNCSYIAKGHTEEEVISMMMEHAMFTHPEKIKEMMLSMTEEDIAKLMGDKIRREI